MIEWKQWVQKLRRLDSKRHRKSTWRTDRYFVDFESRIYVEVSTSNQCHNFHVHSSFKIDVISKNFHVEFQRRIDGESVKMGALGRSISSAEVSGADKILVNIGERLVKVGER